MKSCFTFLSLITCLLSPNFLTAQTGQPAKSSTKAVNVPATLVTIDYGLILPAGDMAKRFGMSSKVGGNVLHKTTKNFLYGVDGYFLFGNLIAEDSLAINLINSDGYITGTDGLPADVNFFLRGYLATVKMGKIFEFGKAKNPGSGLFVLGGVGYMQHKIHIDEKSQAVPQLQGEYKKGYDRLTNGPALQQNIGYIHLNKNRRVNFWVAFEMVQAFTKNQRSFNFDTKTSETGRRTDLLFGLRLGWILPVYAQSKEHFYIN